MSLRILNENIRDADTSEDLSEVGTDEKPVKNRRLDDEEESLFDK